MKGRFKNLCKNLFQDEIKKIVKDTLDSEQVNKNYVKVGEIDKSYIKNHVQPNKDNSKKLSLTELLELFLKLLSLASIFSLLIGGMVIYDALVNIGAKNLFSDLITSSSSLLAIMFSFLVLSIMFFGTLLLAPHITAYYFLKFEDFGRRFFVFLIFILILDFVLGCIHFVYVYDFHGLFLIGVIVLNSILFYCFFRRYFKNEIFNSKVSGKVIDVLFVINVFCFLFLLSVLLILVFFEELNGGGVFYFSGDKKEVVAILVFFIVIIVVCLNLYVAYKWFSVKNLPPFVGVMIFTLCMCVFVNYLFFSVTNVNTSLLPFLGYAEVSKNSKWYLVDNDFINSKIELKENNSQSKKGSGDNLDRLQSKFFLYNSKLKELCHLDDRQEIMCSNDSLGASMQYVITFFDKYKLKEGFLSQKRYSNAIYGYFAWNLGDVKIFCPSYIQVGKEVGEKCLWIKGEYLTPLPEILQN